MASLVVVQHKQPSSAVLSSSLSDFNGARLTSSLQCKRKVWQAKGALRVSASSGKKILIMGGTRFIGIFLSRLLVKEGHQVTLFTRGKAPIAQQLPGEPDAEFSDFSSKILHLKGDRKDFDFVKSSLSAEGYDVVYDINGREAVEVEPILDALPNLPQGENYSHPKICFFHVLFKGAALAFYILSALFVDNFVIIFVTTVLLAALDFWVVKNVSGRILVGLRWWNEINDDGESVWKFECLDQESMARMNKKDSWLFWWTLYLTAVAWIFFAIFSLIRFQADYLLVVGVCLTLSIANIIGFTKCRKDAKKQLQAFATQTIASRFQSTIQTAFSVV